MKSLIRPFLRLLGFISLMSSIHCATAQTFQWSRSGVSPGFEYGNGVVTDDSGNVYVAGQIEYTTDFGNGFVYTVDGQHDIFTAKYNSSGVLQWVRVAGGPEGDAGSAIGIDAQRNVYIVGEFEETAGFDPGDSLTIRGYNDAFLVKYNSNGVFQWVQQLGGGSDDRARAVAVDADGYSYSSGGFGGTAYFGNLSLTSGNGGQDCFLVKFDRDGNAVWARKGGGNRDDRGRGVTLDALGNVFVSGTFSSTATFSGVSISDQDGEQSTFLAKYDTSGTLQWILPIGGCCDTTRGYAITTDSIGNSYLTGYFADTLIAQSHQVVSAGNWDVFIIKVSPSGQVEWLKRAGGVNEDFGSGCRYDPTLNLLYVTGQFDFQAVFDTIHVTSNGNRDFFVAAYDTTGRIRWIRNGGGTGRDAGISITTDRNGAIYATGFFNDTATFGGVTLQGYPLADFVLTKLFPVSASQPSTPATAISLQTGNCNDVFTSWINGSGSRRIVVVRANGPVNANPLDGTPYAASSVFGAGSDLGGGNYVAYDGSGSFFTLTGLTVGVRYFFAVFEYNGLGNSINYLTSTYPIANILANSFNFPVTASPAAICTGSSSVLTASNAITYSWTPSTGLSSTTDSVVTATPSVTTTYTVTGTNAQGCTSQNRITVNVSSIPTVSLGTFSSVCTGNAPFVLTGGSPTGGTYSGPGVSSNTFNPAVAGTGTHIITYTYANSSGCSASDTSTITVIQSIPVSFSSLSPVCSNSSVVTLSGGSPAGGVYAGQGVSNGQFNPLLTGSGSFVITYTYTDGSGCSGSDTSLMVVNPATSVSLSLAVSSVCRNSASFVLSGGNPAGGTYTGTGVSNGSFFPSVAGVGVHPITYSYFDSFGCGGTATSNITVNQLPAVSLSPFNNVCSGASPFVLSGGTPAGGTYGGGGVSNNMFYPSTGQGTYQIIYNYTNSNGCTNFAVQPLTVDPSPVVSLGPDSVVCSGTAVSLSATPGMTTYQWSTGATTQSIVVDSSGTGIGTRRVWVSISNGFNCVSRDTIDITFDACAGVAVPSGQLPVAYIYPNPFRGNFKMITTQRVHVRVFDISGRLIEQQEAVEGIWEAGDLWQPGVYLVEVSNGNARRSYRVVRMN